MSDRWTDPFVLFLSKRVGYQDGYIQLWTIQNEENLILLSVLGAGRYPILRVTNKQRGVTSSRFLEDHSRKRNASDCARANRLHRGQDNALSLDVLTECN